MGLEPGDATPTPTLAQQTARPSGVRNLVVTMGPQGCLLLNDEGLRTVPGVIIDVVDTTGTGDAFNAGLAIALAEGRSLDDAVRFANIAKPHAGLYTPGGYPHAGPAGRRRRCSLYPNLFRLNHRK